MIKVGNSREMAKAESTRRKRAAKSKFGPRNRKYRIFVWSILAIQIAHFALFWVYVNINSVLLAFKNSTGGHEYWTAVNFEWVTFTLNNEYGNVSLDAIRIAPIPVS